MPADLFLKSVDLDYLYPRFLEKLLRAKAAARDRGASYLSTEGWRSMGRSFQLHQAYLEGGPRAAPAGQSGHNFGLCTDEALIIAPSPKRVLRWGRGAKFNEPDDYAILQEELAKEGLLSGASYGDWPHVDFPGFVTGVELRPLLDIWNKNNGLQPLPRLQKVWQYLDSQVQP